jgi:phosphotransferase system HPr (HPr) family protein
MSPQSAEATVTIANALGLHIHPAELIAKTAFSFLSKVTITRGKDVVSARSAVALTTLGAAMGERLTIRAEGRDAEAAVSALVALFESGFGEV